MFQIAYVVIFHCFSTYSSGVPIYDLGPLSHLITNWTLSFNLSFTLSRTSRILMRKNDHYHFEMTQAYIL